MPKDPLQEDLDALKGIAGTMGRGTDDESVRSFYNELDDEEREGLSAIAGDTDEPEEPAKPLKVKIGDKEFEAATQADLEAKVRAWASARPSGADAPGLTPQAVAQLRGQTKAEDKPAPPAEKFDIKKYAEKFGEDPVAAQDYLEQFAEAPRRLKQELEGVKSALAAREQEAFLDFTEANPDFPVESTDVINFLENITRSAKLTVTKRNLASAWKYMKDQGLAVPKTVALPPTEEKPAKGKAAAQAAEVPPRGKRRSASPPTGALDTSDSALGEKLAKLAENAEDIDQLRDEFERMGLFSQGSASRFAGTGPIN